VLALVVVVVSHSIIIGKAPLLQLCVLLRNMETYTGFTLPRAILASAFVFVTAADDSVWLAPHLHGKATVVHIFTFILTLLFAVIVSWFMCWAITNGLIAASPAIRAHYAEWFQVFATVLTWCLTIYLLVKTVSKLKRKREQRSSSESLDHIVIIDTITHSNSSASDGSDNVGIAMGTNSRTNSGAYHNYESISESPLTNTSRWSYGSAVFQALLLDNKEDESQVAVVIHMTLTRTMDEILCFPALMMGNFFTVQELLVGTVLAGILIVILVHTVRHIFFGLDRCKCVLDVLNSIPLFGIVAIIAIIQTVDYLSIVSK
jgi:membrane protein implicated in regulation of membrane protease activity